MISNHCFLRPVHIFGHFINIKPAERVYFPAFNFGRAAGAGAKQDFDVATDCPHIEEFYIV
jgi:hypothetical protein